MALYPFLPGGYEQSPKQSYMGHYGVVVPDGEERRFGVHNNVPHEFSVALSREDVVYAFPVTCPVEGMRDAVLEGTEKRVHRARSWLEAKANKSSPLSFCVSRP